MALHNNIYVAVVPHSHFISIAIKDFFLTFRHPAWAVSVTIVMLVLVNAELVYFVAVCNKPVLGARGTPIDPRLVGICFVSFSFRLRETSSEQWRRFVS